MPDDLDTTGQPNRYDAIDPEMAADTALENPKPNRYAEAFPDPLATDTTSRPGTFLSSALRGVLPTAGGMAAAGAGAEIGGAIGAAVGGPAAPVTGLIGGLVGGIGGFFAGAGATESAQEWGLHQLPDSWTEAIGQSDRAQRAQEAQHPVYSFLGGLAPYAVTMSPGAFTTKAIGLPENATTFQRLMANPITGRLFGGAAMGGLELVQEEAQGQSPDWTRVAISTGFGLIFNKPTEFGKSLTEFGEHLPYRLVGRTRPVPPEGVLSPSEPTVAQAGDLGVIGPGATEATFRGDQQQSLETRTTAQNAAADEQAALGAWPTPDQEAVARRAAPELFTRNDELLTQRDALRQFIQEQSNPTDGMIAEASGRLQDFNEQLAGTVNRAEQRRIRVQQRAAQAEINDLTRRRQAWEAGTAVDTPDVMLARQHLVDTEHALWDLGPEISAARRRAAEYVGDLEEPPAVPARGATIEGEAAPGVPPVPEPVRTIGGSLAAGPQEPAQKTPEQQRGFITGDRTAALMAAGMPRAQAEASAHVEAAYYETLAARFNGALGSAEDLYRARAARVVGPNGEPVPITRAEPTPVKMRTIAEIQAQDKVSARRAKAIQDADILARGRVIEPVRFGEPPPRAARPASPPTQTAPAAPETAPAARTPELAEVPQEPVTQPAAQRMPWDTGDTPRIPTPDDMQKAGIPPSRYKAVQDEAIARVAEHQAANRSSEPRPRRNRAITKLADDTGIPSAGVPEAEVLDEIVDRLPPERVEEEIAAEAEAGEIEYREAEKAAKEWVAYHGTPHEFDQFGLSKIGTGEGSQAFGYGFYFAERKDVAESYNNKLTKGPRAELDLWLNSNNWGVGPSSDEASIKDVLAHWNDPTLREAANNTSVIRDVQTVLRGRHDDGTFSGEATQALSRLDAILPQKGNLLTVRLHAKPEEMLDWDKSLSAQSPKVREALAKTEYLHHAERAGLKDPTGEQLIQQVIGDARRSSEILSQAGIKGIRYLDQGSRNAGEWHITPPEQTTSGKWMVKSSDYNSKELHFDTEAEAKAALDEKIRSETHNIVMFDPHDIEITHRNGEPVTPHAPTAAEAEEIKKAQEEAAWNPDTFYDSDQARPDEELEREHQSPEQASAPEQRPVSGGEPEAPAVGEEPVPEGGGPPEPVGGAGGRPAEEVPEPSAVGPVEQAVAAAGAGPDYRPEPAEPAAAAEPAPAAGPVAPAAGQPEPAGGAAAERRVDGRGNPIFAKGERVVIPDGEQLAGRHGTVEEANGLVFQSIYGGQRSEANYHYTVRTDQGNLAHATSLAAETGERPAAVPDPVYQGHAIDPASLQRSIAVDNSAATNYTGRAARARTQKMKAEWQREAAAKRAASAAQQDVLDVWATAHPEEAERVLGKSSQVASQVPSQVPSQVAEQPAPTGNRDGMSIIESRHTKKHTPLWVVTGGARVENAEFAQMRSEAKQNGGWWSTYGGHGAIPGWTFETREGAEAFMRGGETPTTAEITGQAGQERPVAPEPRGPTSVPETPEARNISDALAPADGKGPLPVTSAPERGPRAIVDDARFGQAAVDALREAFPNVKEPIVNARGMLEGHKDGLDFLRGWIVAKEGRVRSQANDSGPMQAGYDAFKNAPERDADLDAMFGKKTPEQAAADRAQDAAIRDQVAKDRAEMDARLKAAETPPPESTPAAPAEPAAYGANNKIFTAEAAERARQRMRDKLNRLNVGFDAEMMADGFALAGFHIEAGARRFADYSRAMIGDMGEAIRPYLQHFYNSVRDFPGFDNAGMDGRAEVERAAAEAPPPVRGPETAEERADIDRLLDTHQHDPIINDIARLTAEGRTPEEIEAERPGDHYSLEEIDGIVRALERRGEIPELEVEEDGVQGTLPLRDEGTGPEDVYGAPEVGEPGGAPSGEVAGGTPPAAPTPGEQAEGQPRPVPTGGPEGGRGDRPLPTDRIPDTGEGSKSGATGRFADRPDARVEGSNFSIEPGDLAEGRGRRQKARDNIAAIDIAKRLIAEDRPATKAEQAILVKYTGWGGLKNAFPVGKKIADGFGDIAARLREVLTPEEYRRAQQSTQYAHYTAEHVVRSMWDAVSRMGYKGGLTFEPGMGIGHFLGMMPQDLAHATEYSGIERDPLTAQIAKLLYPESGVRMADYTRTAMPVDYFDLAIGNPPFGDITIVSDPRYAARGFSLHDYFFAKSLDSVRPGGLLAFITSAHTMNNMGAAAREYMADRAEFVGGVRLPSSTFRQNAGTEVTTDILFLRKRLPGEEAGPRDWTETVQRTLPSEKFGPTETQVSRYFTEHPENVLGDEVWGETQATGDYAVEQRPGTDLATDLRAAIDRLPADVMTEPPTPEERATLDFSSGQKKDGSFYLSDDGTIMQYRDGAGQPVKNRGAGTKGGFTLGERDRITHLIPMRDALRDVFAADLAKDDAAGAAARERLNEHYDRFVDKFGPVNQATFRYQRPTVGQAEAARLEAREEARYIGEPFDDGDFDPQPMLDNKASPTEIGKARQAARDAAAAAGRKFNEGTFDPAEMPDNVYEQRPNIRPFMSDPESYRMRSIEEYNDATGEASKKAIFYRSILKFEEEPDLRSANDGVLWSMNALGKFDIDAIAEKMGKERADIVQELGDSIYKVPGTRDTYQTKDEYLSGDVVSKLETARAEGETDPDVRRNIAALEAALPPPLPPSEISMLLGMPWIPTEVVTEFARDQLQLGEASIGHSKITGTWYATGSDASAGAARWGIEGRTAFELLSDTMNRTPPRIYAWEGSGRDRKRVFDAVATQAAQDRVNALKQEFVDWVAADTERADGLANLYNDTMNRTVLRQYDGSYMTTPGVATDWNWRGHQTRVVARIVQDGNTYMAHAVGAGKTSAMIGAGMEMRRLGLVRKPLYVVPNHMLGQFTKEFYEQYPTARIAVADEERFHTDRRRQFVANVSQDDVDAVIMTHSSFGKLPIGDEFQAHLIQEQIDMLDEAIRELQGPDNRIARGRVENQKEKLEQKLSKAGKPDQDQTLSFEELGADFLFVDEAHMFRKLSFASKQSGMKGISPEGSDMAWDLYTKVRYLDSQKPGRSHVFASGTPITNTMGELYSLSRYMQREALEKRGLSHFDSWAQNFGDTKTGLEETAAGTYQPVTRFGKFVNLPELYKMVGEVMDIVTPAQLEQYVTRPSLQSGQRQFHLAPRTEILDRYQADLGARMEAIKARKRKPEPGDDILLSVINDGRHAAIDPRFVEETQNDPRSKLNMMIENVARIYHDTGDKQFYDPATNYQTESFKGPATQMIFANLGVNGRGPMDFSTYQWIKEALRRGGVAPEHIAFIGDYKTALERQKLFNDMNDGTVRVLVGSTQKMGTGVNAQRRLYAIHNLDPLWFPADDEQRVGRILRQGNHNPSIEVHDYSTKGTYDSAMWKMMGNKARFIEQFFRGDPNLRDMEDIGEASMYEQASAMATTDERIITLTQMKQDLDKARRQEAAHDREQYSLRQQLKSVRWDQDYYAKRAASIRQDIERREDITGDKFTVTLGGKEYTKRTEANEALRELTAERADGLGKGADTVIGRIGGFSLVMRRDTGGGVDFGIRRSDGDFSIVGGRWSGGKAAHEASVEAWNKMTPDEQENRLLWKPSEPGATGVIASVESQLRKFETWEEDAKTNVAMAARKETNIRPLIGQEFTGGDAITRLSNAVNDLEGMLRQEAQAKGKAPEQPEAAAPQGAGIEAGDTSRQIDLGDGAEMREPTETGRAVDLEQRLRQTVQGKIRIAPGDVRSVITLARTADASTFMHETSHDWLKQLLMDAGHALAPDQLRADAATVRRWLKRGDDWTGFKANGTPDVAPQEKFARGFEQYLREGVAPSKALASVFRQFKSWLTTIYRTLRGLGAPINDDIRGVFDRMLAIEPEGRRTTTAEPHERQPGLGAVHNADATETEPHEAEAVADRMAAERNRAITTPPPEIANELATQEAAAGQPGGTAATEPGGEAGASAGGGGEVAPGGGQPEPPAKGGGVGAGYGDVGAGGGEAAAEGAGVSERPGGANGRRGAGSTPGAEQFAPSPADTFPDTVGAERNVDLAGNIRVENLTDIQSIADAIHDSAVRNGDFRDERGGMTKGRMSLLADSLGLDATDLDQTRLTRLFGGTELLGAKILAARRLVVQSANIVSNLMKTAAESKVDQDVAALGVAIARHDMIQASLSGVTAEWGRAGNAFHSLLEGWDKALDLNQLLKDNLGRDLYQLKAIAMMGSRMDTPGKMSKYLRDTKQRSFGRMLMEYWINGLISGPSTHVTYSVGNVILASMKAGPETAIAAGIGALRQQFGREGERVRFGEVGAQFRAAMREAPAAVQASIEAARSGVTTLLPGETGRAVMPFQGDTLTIGRNMTNAPVTWHEVAADAYGMVQGMRDAFVAGADLVSAGGEAGSPWLRVVNSPLGAIPNVQVGRGIVPVGTLARLPSRSVAAIHSLFRAMNYSMDINALAYRQAASEGLSGTALAARTADLRQNPTDAMMEIARGKATDLTLMGQGGRLTNALSEFFNKSYNVPFLGETQLLKFVDPFVHIAGNIMNQSLMQRTPIGLLSPEIRADLAGRNGNIAQDTAMAKMIAGSALAIGAGGLAAQGLVSGSGPSKPDEAAMWRLAGNQAHSVRIGDIWYDMHRLGPIGLLLSVAADLYDVAHQIGKEDADVVGKSLMHAFTQNILDESFMRGPADLIKATTDPGRYGAGYVRNTLASFMPYSVGMAQMARATDPYSRQARTIMDTIRAHTPGLSQDLLARRDIWGNKMPNRAALGMAGLTSIWAQHVSNDPVNQAMLDLGIAPAQVERQIRNVHLTDQEFDDFARIAGNLAKMRLDVFVRSPEWQMVDREHRHIWVQAELEASREAARGEVMKKYPHIPHDAAVLQLQRRTGANAKPIE